MVFGADGNLNGNRPRAQALANFVDDGLEVRARAVHLVDERQARHVEVVGLVPHGFRLRLDARDAAKHDHRAVEHAQRPLDLDGEVDVAGRIDKVDVVAAPFQGRGRRGDGDAALALLRHPVHLRFAVVHFADFVNASGVVQEAFADRGLAGINVRANSNVAHARQLGRLLRFGVGTRTWIGHGKAGL